MSDHTPKRSPESLREFAALAKISDESLHQILENLQQAGIAVKDPDEKLSPQIRRQVLAFFQEKVKTATGIKNTRTSKLKSRIGTATSVTITTVSRKVKAVPNPDQLVPEPVPAPSASESLLEADTPLAAELDAMDPISETADKKQKITPPKRKSKLQPDFKSTKRSKHKPDHMLESVGFEAADDDSDEVITTTSSTSPHGSQKPSNHRSNILQQTFKKPTSSIMRDIWIPEQVTVLDLAKKMSIKDVELVAILSKMGVSITHYEESIDQDIAVLLVEEMGHRPRLLLHNREEIALRETLEQQMGEPHIRAPIITIMGHVDHGKTSILDYIKKTRVAAKEAGGITQHIAAYHVSTMEGMITFLDTPGHATFTAMRARGARLTDIVVLVVAADDGVMPQTVEAIEHAQAANVPIVVVVNKMDKPGATMELVQQGLAKYNLIPEDWGGETLFVPVSAKTGAGIDDLLKALLLQAEMSELKAPTIGPAQGTVIESRLDKNQGTIATLIVQKGTLKKGDILLAGTSFGRIRALYDENRKTILSATPSIPVEVLGLSTPPAAGEEAIVVPNERKAREIAQARNTAARALQLQNQTHRSIDSVMDPLKHRLHKSIPVILKADVQGSAEALKEALLKLSTEEVAIKPLLTNVGMVIESDVNLAIASKAIIFAFNVQANNIAKRLIEREKVVVHYHTIIYELIDEAKKIASGLLEPEIKETTFGKATIRELFKAPKASIVVGCIVTEGSIHSHHNIRVVRNQKILYQGKIHSLRRFKDDVKEVMAGSECGISLRNCPDVQVGDTIESYESITISRKIE
jgi:translation initiation factor IF-2